MTRSLIVTMLSALYVTMFGGFSFFIVSMLFLSSSSVYFSSVMTNWFELSFGSVMLIFIHSSLPSVMMILPCWVIFTFSSPMFAGSFISCVIEKAGWIRRRVVTRIDSMMSFVVFLETGFIGFTLGAGG